MRWGLAASVLSTSAMLAAGGAAETQPAVAGDAVAEDTGAVEPAEQEQDWGYWGNQPSRWHASFDVGLGGPTSLGATYGYGKPYWFWGGVSAMALTTNEFAAVRAGPQVNLLIVNLSVQLRRTFGFARRLPVPAASYSDSDLVDASRPTAHYSSLDGALWGLIPAGPTLGIAAVNGVVILDLPENTAVYSEFFRFTLNQNVALQPQLSWFYRLLDDTLLIGPAVDAVLSPDRDPVLRVGGGVFYDFGNHLSLEILGTVAAVTPDPQLDWVTQTWGIARVRWKYATGEPEPGVL